MAWSALQLLEVLVASDARGDDDSRRHAQALVREINALSWRGTLELVNWERVALDTIDTTTWQTDTVRAG